MVLIANYGRLPIHQNMLTLLETLDLERQARELRIKVLDLALEVKDCHLGGCFSEIEILLSLFRKVLREEDTFILSKGHCGHPYYILLREKGYNPKPSPHPDIDIANGIPCTTGSLGHGLPIGAGMAFARKLQNRAGRIYVLMGDGECEEGTTYESALFASKHKLDNLHVIVDYNKLQALEELVLPIGRLRETLSAIGWAAKEVDGHAFSELIPEMDKTYLEKPYVIIAHTIKGKGVSYMENNPEWHGKKATPERLAKAYEELKR